METYKRIVIGGGARAGKSAFALALARELGTRRLLLATAQPLDDEMRERIARHRGERGQDFETLEEPLDVAGVVAALTGVDVIVLDCVTLWLSNLLLAGRREPEILAQVDVLSDALARAPFHAVLVTNEVGMGLVPDTALGRAFRDLAGRVHQRLARVANELYLGVLGTIVRLRPEPGVIAS